MFANGSIAAIPSASQTRQVHQRLRTDLLNGRWSPGAKLLMHELRRFYESGASPLREALSRLANEGLVVHTEQRGFAAAAVSLEELRDIVRTRSAVETLALAQGAPNWTQQAEETLVLAFHRLSRTSRSTDNDSYRENPLWEQQHRAFHEALLAPCESPLLLGFCEQLYDRAYRYRQLAARTAYKQRNEHDEHRAIFEAVLQRRLDEAQALLADHYARTAELFTAAS